MKNSFKKILLYEVKGIPHEYLWAAFLLPIFLLGAAFASQRVLPFGETSLLTCDLYHQYAPILTELRNKILSGDSLFYTWNMGLGTNFWSILSYYGASPLNIFLLLFPQTHLSAGITFMILLRTGLSGLFFSILIHEKDRREDTVTLALSTVYALCGYVLAYFWNLMWMDAVLLLPLIVLGLWKLFMGGKPFLYVITLFLAILSNFYAGFFICLFLIFFAPILYMEVYQNRMERWRPALAALQFAGYSILAAGMSSVLLVPAAIALKATTAASDSVVMTADLSFPLFDFLTRFLLHADPVIRSGLPNVFCSVVILILILLYSICTAIPLSRRIVSLVFAFFLYISMDSPVLNYFWHGMHYTNQIPYRQAFLLSFYLLYMSSQVMLHIDCLSKKKVYIAGSAVLIYLLILSRTPEIQKQYWLIYGSAAFIIIYMTVLSGFFSSEKGKKWARKAFLYVVILEMFLAAEFAVAYIGKTEDFTYSPLYGQYAEVIDNEISSLDGEQFNRTVLLPSQTENDSALYHLKSIPIFASTTSFSLVTFMDSLGFANNQANSVRTDGITEVSARLLGIKNMVMLTESTPEVKEPVDRIGITGAVFGGAAEIDTTEKDAVYTGYKITQNDNSLPIGFYVPLDGIQPTLNQALSPFDQTNILFSNLGTQNVYASGSLSLVSAANIEKSEAENAYKITAAGQTATLSVTPEGIPANKDILLYVDTRQQPTIRITRIDTASGASSVTVLPPDLTQIRNCGKALAEGEGTTTIQLVFSNPTQETFPIYCYTIDEIALDDATAKLNSFPLTITSYDSSHLTGTVDFAGNGALFTTIPYDKGWTVKVDGQKVTAQAAYGALLSVPVSKGVHEIKFSYQPPGFWAGLLISLIMTADFAALCLWNPFSMVRRHKTRKEFDSIVEKEELQ